MTAEVALVAYAGLSVVVPVTSLLLIRLVDRLGIDRFVDQYQQVSRGPAGSSDTPVTAGSAAGRCPDCGERNDCDFSFCRACQARIGT